MRRRCAVVLCVLLVAACDGAGAVRSLRSSTPGAGSPSLASAAISPFPASAASERAVPSPRTLRLIEAVRRGIGPDRPAFVAIAEHRYLPMWGRPRAGPPDLRFDARALTPSSGRSPMLIAGGRIDARGRAWYRVYLPIRPNGATGWIRARDVEVRRRRELIEVDLSRRVLRRYRDGELLERLRVGVGSGRYPTATGTFYVWVKVRYDPPSQAYGIFALGLSGFSPVLTDWPGGGRMAIHGTPYASDRGRAVSHGCVRVWDPEMRTLTDVPLGTPVLISW